MSVPRTYAVVAACDYRPEIRRYDITAASTDEARKIAADRYGHEPGIGVDPHDVTITYCQPID